MSSMQRLLNRLMFNREAQAKPYRILSQLEGDPQRRTWDYCATPGDAVKALRTWQQSLTARGYTICQANTFWIVFHLPTDVEQALQALDAQRAVDPGLVPLDELRPPHHAGTKKPRHLILSIVNVTVGATPSLWEYIRDPKRSAVAVWYGVN